MYEISSCFTSSPAPGVVSLLDFGHSNRCIMVSFCFNLLLPDNVPHGASFHYAYLPSVYLRELVHTLKTILLLYKQLYFMSTNPVCEVFECLVSSAQLVSHFTWSKSVKILWVEIEFILREFAFTCHLLALSTWDKLLQIKIVSCHISNSNHKVLSYDGKVLEGIFFHLVLMLRSRWVSW